MPPPPPTEEGGPPQGTSKPPPAEGSNLSGLSKARIHVGRLYQIHAWMPEEEKTCIKTRRALFNAVNERRPGYFNHQVELMDDTTLRFHPCKDFQLNRCKHEKPIHYVTAMKPSGKRHSYPVIHGCDLCFYGRWDLGYHTINECHLKHLLPQGTGENPWDRRDRKLKEERERAQKAADPRQEIITISPPPPPISPMSVDNPSSPSPSISGEEDQEPAKPSATKKTGKKRKSPPPPPAKDQQSKKTKKGGNKQTKPKAKEAPSKAKSEEKKKAPAETKSKLSTGKKGGKSSQGQPKPQAPPEPNDDIRKNLDLLTQTLLKLSSKVDNQHQLFIQHTLAGNCQSKEAPSVDPSPALTAEAGLNTGAAPEGDSPPPAQGGSEGDQYIEDAYIPSSQEKQGDDEYVPQHTGETDPLDKDPEYIPESTENSDKCTKEKSMQELNIEYNDCMGKDKEVETN